MRSIFFTVALFAACAAPAASPEPSLCTKPEKIVFNCRVKNKILSLCASSDFSEKAGTIQYRFGTTTKIELEYPDAPSSPIGHFWSSTAMYAGGGEARIRFRHGDVEYLLFDRTVRTGFSRDGLNNPHFTAGFVTKRGGKKGHVRECSNNAAIPYDVLQYIPEEQFDYDANP